MRSLLSLIVSLGFVLGLFGALMSGWAFIDPAAVQMSNDADPFGTPPSRWESAYVFAFSVTIAAVSARSLFGRFRSDDEGDDDA